MNLQNFFADVAGGSMFTVIAAGLILVVGAIIAAVIVASVFIIIYIKNKHDDNK